MVAIEVNRERKRYKNGNDNEWDNGDASNHTIKKKKGKKMKFNYDGCGIGRA